MSDINNVISGGPCTFVIFTIYASELNSVLIKINSLSPSHNFKFMPGSYSFKAPMQHSVMIEGVIKNVSRIEQIEKLCNNII